MPQLCAQKISKQSCLLELPNKPHTHLKNMYVFFHRINLWVTNDSITTCNCSFPGVFPILLSLCSCPLGVVWPCHWLCGCMGITTGQGSQLWSAWHCPSILDSDKDSGFQNLTGSQDPWKTTKLKIPSDRWQGSDASSRPVITGYLWKWAKFGIAHWCHWLIMKRCCVLRS